jgi:hypothetical protein
MVLPGLPRGDTCHDYRPSVLKRRSAMKKNFVLVGVPGCGKTTLGKQAANVLGMNFIDTDTPTACRTGHQSSRFFLECAGKTSEKQRSKHVTALPFHGQRARKLYPNRSDFRPK